MKLFLRKYNKQFLFLDLILLAIFKACLIDCKNLTDIANDFIDIPSISTIIQGGKDIINEENENLRKGQIIFEDHFTFFDESKWERQQNSVEHFTEFQWYTTSEENSFIENGQLHIKPTLCDSNLNSLEKLTISDSNDLGGSSSAEVSDPPEKCINSNGIFYPINSARVSTQKYFAFKYGYLEIMAKIPSGDWLWPAIWLMPRDNKYQAWPRSGEIDIMESRGNKNLDRNGVNIGCDQIVSTLHWGPARGHDGWIKTTCAMFNESFSSSFHKYQLSWTPDKITFLLDDQEFKSISPPAGGFWELGNFANKTDFINPWVNGTKMAPFDQEFYIILNVAVGGTTFFSDGFSNKGGKPWKNNSPQPNVDFWNGRDQWIPTWNMNTDDSHMVVDYVKVWAM